MSEREGYLMIDNRAGPGLPEGMERLLGLAPGEFDRKGLFEAATYTCPHCQAVVVIEPKRTRERAFCASCDRRVCDDCGKEMEMTRQCRSAIRRAEQEMDRAARGLAGSIIIP